MVVLGDINRRTWHGNCRWCSFGHGGKRTPPHSNNSTSVGGTQLKENYPSVRLDLAVNLSTLRQAYQRLKSINLSIDYAANNTQISGGNQSAGKMLKVQKVTPLASL